MQTHPISSIPFFSAVILERAGYYGLRSILVVFLMSNAINSSPNEAMGIYGTGVGFLAISNLIGGGLGFIGKPKLLAMIGVSLQAMGAFIIAASQTSTTVLIGFVFIGLGAGISRTSLLPFLGKLYQRTKLLDSGIMLNYLMVNVGAFLGVIAILHVSEITSYKTAFLLCGVLYLGAVGLIYLANPSINDEFHEPEKPNQYFLPIVMIGVFGTAFFWMAFEFAIGNMYTLSDLMNSSEIESIVSNSSTINTIVLIVFCLVLTLYFSIKKVATSLQIGLGFGMAFLAFLLLYLVDYETAEIGRLKMMLMSFFVLHSLAELLLGPPITSYIVRKLDVRHSPMVLGAFYFVIAIMQRFVEPDGFGNYYFTLLIVLVTFVIFAGVYFVFYFVRPKKIDENVDSWENDFDI